MGWMIETSTAATPTEASQQKTHPHITAATTSCLPVPKMKVLKKIKRRMGLASRSGSNGGSGVSNLPRLRFHYVHGENVRICKEGTTAKRVESFCKGIAFSSRPVKVNEKIHIKFVEISHNWSGGLRFGFTSNDPSQLSRYNLPKYACPDLTNKPGYWAKALPERFCALNTSLYYYVGTTGDVHFGVNDEEKGVFFGGVDVRQPLWALVDVYGNSTAIEFVDPNGNLNNMVVAAVPPPPPPPQHDEDEEVRLHDVIQRIRDLQMRTPPTLRHQPTNLNFQPLPLHRTKGRNVRFVGSARPQNHAYRTDTEFCQGYVFTARPLNINERVVVQILATESIFQGCLGIGLTSCDPAHLQSTDLPDDSNCLLDRPEYWVNARDFTRHLSQGDEIHFTITPNGEVQIMRNGAAPLVVIHVDQSLRLWAFFDIYGSTQRIRVLSATPGPTCRPALTNQNTSNELLRRHLQKTNSTTSSTVVNSTNWGSNGGAAVLSVILPTAQAANLLNQQGIPLVTSINQHRPQTTSGSTKDMLNDSCHSLAAGWLDPHSTSHHQIDGTATVTECTICYENMVDAVLYMCGHMCMCYECALKQWRGMGGGHCPLCRAVIRDVIRIYKS